MVSDLSFVDGNRKYSSITICALQECVLMTDVAAVWWTMEEAFLGLEEILAL